MWHKRVACWLVVVAVASPAGAGSPGPLMPGPSCTFAAEGTYRAGGSPQSVAIGDLDGDGDLDLAVTIISDDNVSVLLNNGDGTFAVTYGAGDEPLSVSIGDLDGDLDLDLAVANLFSDDVSVLLNHCSPPCPADLDDSGVVDVGDILLILAAWGNKGGPEDLDGSGFVDFGDLLIVLAAWGPCE